MRRFSSPPGGEVGYAFSEPGEGVPAPPLWGSARHRGARRGVSPYPSVLPVGPPSLSLPRKGGGESERPFRRETHPGPLRLWAAISMKEPVFAAGPHWAGPSVVWIGLVALLVLKFGGTSVADIDRIRNVAAHVKREVEAGHAIAVVVSAMAGQTNQLVAWVEQAWGFKERRRRTGRRGHRPIMTSANMTPWSPPASRSPRGCSPSCSSRSASRRGPGRAGRSRSTTDTRPPRRAHHRARGR